jgi:predicted transcriptional regulator
VLSSCLFFDNDLKKKISDKKVDLYSEGVIKPVNLNSIAESTLIPRETVRRVVNSLIEKNILKKNNNKIYVTEFVTGPKFLVTSSNKTLRNMLHDTLVIIAHMFNPV